MPDNYVIWQGALSEISDFSCKDTAYSRSSKMKLDRHRHRIRLPTLILTQAHERPLHHRSLCIDRCFLLSSSQGSTFSATCSQRPLKLRPSLTFGEFSRGSRTKCSFRVVLSHRCISSRLSRSNHNQQNDHHGHQCCISHRHCTY